MATYCADNFGALLNDYADSTDHWKVAHDEVEGCQELETTLVLGLSLLIAIDLIDNRWRTDLYANSAPFDPAQEQEIENFYRAWCRPGKQILERIRHFETLGYEVKWAKEFSQAYQEAKGCLTPDSEYFTGDPLTNARDAAIDAHREGRTVEFHEFGK